MARMAHRAAPAKTPIFVRNNPERGMALLEAAIALAIVAMVAATGLTAFSRASAVNQTAEARLEALAQAENALERASAAGFLAEVLDEGQARITGDGWQVTGVPYPDAQAGDSSPMALVELTAVAGKDASSITLKTLRTIPK